MAVKVTVYGTANMKQIENARAELDKLESAAKGASGGFAASMANMGKSVSSAGESMKGVGDSMTRNLTLPLAAAGAGLYKAGEAAAADAKEQVLLANALQNTAGATKSQIAQTEAWITAQGKALGFTDSSLRPALATLATATHDVTKAQQLAGLAMDIAAQKGIPVETAAKALAKAYAGQGTALGKILPGIDKATLSSKNFGDIQKAVADIVGGAAAKAADTEAGARQRANVQLNEAIESLGYAFMPIMKQLTDLLANQVVPAITKLATWFGNLSPAVKQIIVDGGLFLAIMGPTLSIVGRVTEGIGGLITGLSKAPAAFTAVSNGAKALWAVMAANPFLAIAAVVAVVAVLIITHWDTVKTTLTKTWNAITNAASAAWDWIKEKVGAVLNFIKTLVMNWTIAGQIAQHWDAIRDGAERAWDAVVSFFKQAPSRIKSAIGNLGDLLVNVGKDLVMGLWNGISNMQNWVLDKIKGFGSSVLSKIKSVFGIRSPSAETEAMGGYLAQGLVVGLNNSMGTVGDAATELGQTVFSAIAKALGKLITLLEQMVNRLNELLNNVTINVASASSAVARTVASAGGSAAAVAKAAAEDLATIASATTFAAIGAAVNKAAADGAATISSIANSMVSPLTTAGMTTADALSSARYAGQAMTWYKSQETNSTTTSTTNNVTVNVTNDSTTASGSTLSALQIQSITKALEAL